MAGKSVPAEGPRRQLKRAACPTQAFRDALIPEVAAKIAPFGQLLHGPAESLEWACPPPDGELSEREPADIARARAVISSLLGIAKTNSTPAELVLPDWLSELAESPTDISLNVQGRSLQSATPSHDERLSFPACK